jgi:uncharacterized protein
MVGSAGERFSFESVIQAKNLQNGLRTSGRSRGLNGPKFILIPTVRGSPACLQAVALLFPFGALGEGITFLSAPFAQPIELTGPVAARLQISSSTVNADIFLIVRLFGPDLKEVSFQGALDPHTPIAQGWLRASHRKIDPDRSLPYRPWHPHDEEQPLMPGEIYSVDIEIWPTCIVVPKGYRVGLSVRGCDYVYPGASGGRLSNMKNGFTGCGPFLHDDPDDRPAEIFGGTTTVHFGKERENFVLLPVVPVVSP